MCGLGEMAPDAGARATLMNEVVYSRFLSGPMDLQQVSGVWFKFTDSISPTPIAGLFPQTARSPTDYLLPVRHPLKLPRRQSGSRSAMPVCVRSH